MTENSIQIRPMTKEDLPRVLAIEKVSFPTPFSEHLFLIELNLSIAHLDVILVDGLVAGYIDYWLLPGEMHLINIAVAPDQRGKGVGHALMEYLLTFARRHKVTEIQLDVRRSNDVAIHLYERFGFQVVGVRKNYYQNNREDAFMMTCSL